MNWLVTGAYGMLGTDLVDLLRRCGQDVTATDIDTLDITDADAVDAAVRDHQIVVNAAAWTAVDDAEEHEDRARTLNADAPRLLARAAGRHGARLVQLSTDYVFDGLLDRPYIESDAPAPQSVYGASKLAGEHEASALGTSATIVRTSWVCSQNGSNMVKTIMRLAGGRKKLAFVDDQIGNPTFTADLAPMIRRLALDRRSGVHHVTNQTSTSWYGFAREVVTAMGKNPDMVRPITTAELQPPRPARRPPNSVLDNMVLKSAGLALLRDFRDPLRETVSALS